MHRSQPSLYYRKKRLSYRKRFTTKTLQYRINIANARDSAMSEVNIPILEVENF